MAEKKRIHSLLGLSTFRENVDVSRADALLPLNRSDEGVLSPTMIEFCWDLSRFTGDADRDPICEPYWPASESSSFWMTNTLWDTFNPSSWLWVNFAFMFFSLSSRCSISAPSSTLKATLIGVAGSFSAMVHLPIPVARNFDERPSLPLKVL